MMSFILNLFLFLLGLGIGIKYERWTRDRLPGGHSKFQETGFAESRQHSRHSGFKASTNARPSAGGKKNSRFHIS
jgi:hypothetical protein